MQVLDFPISRTLPSALDALISQALVFAAQAFDLPLILLALGGKVLLPLRLAHELIANQRAGNQSHRPADQSAHRCMADGAADDRTGASAQARADQAALLARGDRRRATGKTKDQQPTIVLTKVAMGEVSCLMDVWPRRFFARR